MTKLELLDIMGNVKSAYIWQAQELRSGTKQKKAFPYLRHIAAVLALILLLAAFAHTAPGAAAVDFIKETITNLIETLFPPKQMTILLEGMEYTADYAADGVEPDSKTPGFAIYYDVDSYRMEKEGDVTYIRSDYASPSLPPCEIEIIHLDTPFAETAAQARAELAAKWQITEYTAENRITYDLLGEQKPDSPVEDWDFFSDGQGGCFRIIRRYFYEATEGHGMRFAAIVNTFTVLPESAG